MRKTERDAALRRLDKTIRAHRAAYRELERAAADLQAALSDAELSPAELEAALSVALKQDETHLNELRERLRESIHRTIQSLERGTSTERSGRRPSPPPVPQQKTQSPGEPRPIGFAGMISAEPDLAERAEEILRNEQRAG